MIDKEAIPNQEEQDLIQITIETLNNVRSLLINKRLSDYKFNAANICEPYRFRCEYVSIQKSSNLSYQEHLALLLLYYEYYSNEWDLNENEISADKGEQDLAIIDVEQHLKAFAEDINIVLTDMKNYNLNCYYETEIIDRYNLSYVVDKIKNLIVSVQVYTTMCYELFFGEDKETFILFTTFHQ